MRRQVSLGEATIPAEGERKNWVPAILHRLDRARNLD
jgi:hypothetical protein